MAKRYSDEKVKEILKLHEEGLSPKGIAKVFGTYNTSIRRILLANGRTLKNAEEATVRSVNHNPFEDLSNPEVQYWLGYLISDGNVSSNRNRINISTNVDPEHLHKYICFIGEPLPISKYFNTRYGVWEYSVNFSNPAVKEFLISLGIKPKKSLDLKLITPITFDMIRGLLDGDGCVRKCKNTIVVELMTASESFSHQIKEFLESNGILCTHRKAKNNYNGLYYVAVRAESVESFYHHIYSGATVFLERKHVKFGPLIEKSVSIDSPNSVKGSTPNAELAVNES